MNSVKMRSVLEAGKQSFIMFGYRGTTMEHIAKLSKMGKGTLYTIFESKEMLLKEIVLSLVKEMREAGLKSCEMEKDAYRMVCTALFTILSFRKDHELLLKLSKEVQLFGNPAARDALVLVEGEMISFVVELIERAIRSGRMVECDPVLTSFILYKVYVALVSDWKEHGKPLTDEEIRRIMESYLLKHLGKDDGESV